MVHCRLPLSLWLHVLNKHQNNMQNISHFFFVWILHHQTSQANLEAGQTPFTILKCDTKSQAQCVVKGFGHAKSIQLEETVLIMYGTNARKIKYLRVSKILGWVHLQCLRKCLPRVLTTYFSNQRVNLQIED